MRLDESRQRRPLGREQRQAGLAGERNRERRAVNREQIVPRFRRSGNPGLSEGCLIITDIADAICKHHAGRLKSHMPRKDASAGVEAHARVALEARKPNCRQALAMNASGAEVLDHARIGQAATFR